METGNSFFKDHAGFAGLLEKTCRKWAGIFNKINWYYIQLEITVVLCMVRASARQNFDGDVFHRLEILTPQWYGAGRAQLQFLAGWSTSRKSE